MFSLLSRPEFSRLVLARRGGRCVACEKPAVDAHHILERKLFADGGYYLANGAGVCAECHLKCEFTTLSVEEVRALAGIVSPVLPPGFEPGVPYDKWGNRIWPSGLRTVGPLAEDTGMRRALASGGVLGMLMPADYTESGSL